ncbi:MAG TPA: alpha/beta hydrolase [Tepidisphaeraceae bacterium]|nr:alpha/beta hydrolase [Tepidisphaeraceae bacterium]
MLKTLICLALALAFTSLSLSLAADVPASIPLWPHGAPGSEGKTGAEIGKPAGPERGYTSITHVNNPSIIPYLPAKDKATGVAVIVLPGGGHQNLAISHEGYNVGEWLADHGIAGFVVKYRLAREKGSTYKIEREALADTQRAIRTVRARAREWNVNPDAVGVMGFSAGGELASLASIRMDGGLENAPDPIDRQSAKPNFQALIYPGQSGKILPTKDSPPAFLACGNLDRPDISQGMADVYLRFKKVGVPAELHIYAKTGHGFGLRAKNKPPAGEWPTQFQQWLVNMGFEK